VEGIRNPKGCSMEDTQSLVDSSTEGTRVPMDSNGSRYELLKAKNEELERRIETERTYLKKEIERLTLALQESPDPVEFAQMEARYEALSLLLGEKERRIEELNHHKEDMSRFADYFRSTESKLLEAPPTEKKKPWYKFW
jgi:predicted RNase H-like nuclease (RuvC/YqgF family)